MCLFSIVITSTLFFPVTAILYHPGEPMCKYFNICVKVEVVVNNSISYQTCNFDALPGTNSTFTSAGFPPRIATESTLQLGNSPRNLTAQNSLPSIDESYEMPVFLSKNFSKSLKEFNLEPARKLEKYWFCTHEFNLRLLNFAKCLTTGMMVLLIINLQIISTHAARLSRRCVNYLKHGLFAMDFIVSGFFTLSSINMKFDPLAKFLNEHAVFSRSLPADIFSQCTLRNNQTDKCVVNATNTNCEINNQLQSTIVTCDEYKYAFEKEFRTSEELDNHEMHIESTEFICSVSSDDITSWNRSDSVRSCSSSSIDSFLCEESNQICTIENVKLNENILNHYQIEDIKSLLLSPKVTVDYYFTECVPPKPQINTCSIDLLSMTPDLMQQLHMIKLAEPENEKLKLDFELCFLDLTPFHKLSAPLKAIDSVMSQCRLSDRDPCFQLYFFTKLREYVSGSQMMLFWKTFEDAFTKVLKQITMAKKQLERCLQVVYDPAYQLKEVIILDEICNFVKAKGSSTLSDEFHRSLEMRIHALPIKHPWILPQCDVFNDAISFADCGRSLVSDVFGSRWTFLTDYKNIWNSCEALITTVNLEKTTSLTQIQCDELMHLSTSLESLASHGASNIRVALEMMKASRAAWFDASEQVYTYMEEIRSVYTLYNDQSFYNLKTELAFWRLKLEQVRTNESIY